jgi:choline dehydrogenase
LSTDYLIVGAGSAGSVLARRLVDRGFEVHLIESGAGDDGAEFLYLRGHGSDFDEWGLPGWDFDSVLPLFRRSEDFRWSPDVWHGTGGLLPVWRIIEPRASSAAFVGAAYARGFPMIYDFNGAHMIGAGLNQIAEGSAFQNFVRPVMGMPRLKVTTGATVHRVILQRGRAVGVAYRVGEVMHEAFADAEVVLAAGAVGSARILMLSGIGPAGHLGSVGVPVVADLPGVGLNLHDRPMLAVTYEAPHRIPPGPSDVPEGQLITSSSTRTAPAAVSALLHSADPPGSGFTIAAGVLNPQSRGSVRLMSSNPAVAAHSDANILTERHDLEALLDALQISREIGAASTLKPWRKREMVPGPSVQTRAELRELARRAASGAGELAGTCRMGTDAEAVVTPDLVVRGVAGLRVADASIMPAAPSGTTTTASLMIGEKAADLLSG